MTEIAARRARRMMSSSCRCMARWTRAAQDRALLTFVPAANHRRHEHRGNVADRQRRIGGDRYRLAEGRPLRRGSRGRFAHDRARHARQRRSARRPRCTARARHRATPVGRAGSLAAASRGRDSSRRSVRAVAVDPRVGSGSRTAFEWFDRPGDDRITAAMSLLARLGAVEAWPAHRHRPAAAAHPAASATRAHPAGCAWIVRGLRARVPGSRSRRPPSQGFGGQARRRHRATCCRSSIAGIRCRRTCVRLRKTFNRSQQSLLGNRFRDQHRARSNSGAPCWPVIRIASHGVVPGHRRHRRHRWTAWSRSRPVTVR